MSFATRQAWLDAVIMMASVGIVLVLVQSFGTASAIRVATNAAILLIAVLGLQIFSGNTGIVSFGHAGFMAIGAYTTGILTLPAAIQRTALKDLPSWLAGHEMSMLSALLVVVGIMLLLGVVSSLPFFRLGGSSASIATLAMLIIVFSMLVASREITRGAQPFYGVPRSMTLWHAGTAAMAGLLIARLYRETKWGRGARASSDDERGTAAIGVHFHRARVICWILSVVFAGVAGGMMAHFLGAFSPKDFYFELSFSLLAMLIVGGMGTVTGALSGVAVITVLNEIVRRVEGGGQFLGMDVPPIFGLTQGVLAIAMILIIWRRPVGLFGQSELRTLERLGKRAMSQAPRAPQEITTTETLGSVNVSRFFGGVKAVNGITIAFETARISGIIGPNGAGKTTFLNLLSGDIAPTDGKIVLNGQTINGKSVDFARHGIARTFQNLRIFPNMSVLENVALAAAQVAGSGIEAETNALNELRFMQLEEYAHIRAGSLAYGQKRRLEIARALALRPSFLLLDEPAAGMNGAETAQLVTLLRQVRDERGLGIILIEHDMGLVMSLCERVAVIDHGELIADDLPGKIQQNPEVIAAYLGSRAADAMLAGKTA